MTQITLRRLVFRPMLRGKLSPTTAAILTGAAWASLPILASTVGGAEWSPQVVAGGSLVQFVSVALFVRFVVPELQRRGLSPREYRGTTLRENLGLPRPPRGWWHASG